MQATPTRDLNITNICLEEEGFYFFEDNGVKEKGSVLMEKIGLIIERRRRYLQSHTDNICTLSEYEIITLLCSKATGICREYCESPHSDKVALKNRNGVIKTAKKINALLILHPAVVERRAEFFIERAKKFGYDGNDENQAITYFENMLDDVIKLCHKGLIPKAYLSSNEVKTHFVPPSISIPVIQNRFIDYVIPDIAYFVNFASIDYERVLETLDALRSPDFLAILTDPLYYNLRVSHMEAYLLGKIERMSIDTQDPRIKNALHLAASTGNQKIVEFLLCRGVDSAILNTEQLTPLMQARAFPKVVTVLLKYADVNFQNGFGETALHYAVKMNDSAFATVLLEAGADWKKKDENGWTSLHLAASLGVRNSLLTKAEGASPGMTSLIDILMSKGAQLEESDNQNRLPLNCCIDWDTRKHILLLQHNYQRNVVNLIEHKSGANGNTALHFAAKHGCLEAIKGFLQHSGNIDILNDEGITPLYFAFNYGQKDCLEYLLSQGANPEIGKKQKFVENSKNKKAFLISNVSINRNYLIDQTKLQLYSYCPDGENVKMASSCIERGAYLDIQDREGRTPLHTALMPYLLFPNRGNAFTLIDRLIGAGAALNIPDKAGKTPLFYALEYIEDAPSVIRKLVKAGADIDRRLNTGETLLHLAVKKNAGNVVNVLLELGADMNCQTHMDGNTVLHEAVILDDTPVINALIESGIDVNIRNKEDKTAADLSTRNSQLIFYNLHMKRNSFLIEAASNGAIHAIRNLLLGGANIQAKDAAGRNILHLIVDLFMKNKNMQLLETIKNLIEKETLHNVPDNEGKTPLFYTLYHEPKNINAYSETIVRALIKGGADINHQAKDGNTFLHMVAKEEVYELYYLLTTLGADTKIKNVQGLIPEELLPKTRYAYRTLTK